MATAGSHRRGTTRSTTSSTISTGTPIAVWSGASSSTPEPCQVPGATMIPAAISPRTTRLPAPPTGAPSCRSLPGPAATSAANSTSSAYSMLAAMWITSVRSPSTAATRPSTGISKV